MRNHSDHGRRISSYKVFIAILSGVLGLWGVFLTLRLNFNGFSLNFVWSIGLPLMVSLAWGHGYGLLSALAGGAFLYPFILGFPNGWASLVPSISLILWIGLHGYGAKQRMKSEKFYHRLYFIQLVHAGIRLFLYLSLFPILIKWNPPFWNPNAYTEIDQHIVLLFAGRGIIMESVLLAVCDAFLQLPPVRRVFQLKNSSASRLNTRIMAAMVSFGLVFTGFILLIQNYIIDEKTLDQWLLPPDDKTRVTLFLSGILFVIMGSFAVRYFQKALENQESLIKSEQKYYSIFEGIHDVYLETNMDGEILIASPSVKEVLSFDAKELMGKNIAELYLDPDVREDLLSLLKEEGEVNNFEAVLKDKEGKRIFLWLHARMEETDGLIKIITIARDVTNYHEAMDEVRKLNRELSQRVEERTGELKKAVSELEGFAYTISHDLKSPLKAMEAYTSMIKEDVGDDLEKESLDMLEQIQKTSREMIELIEKLLQYALVSKAPLMRETIAVELEIRSLFEEVKAGSGNRALILEFTAKMPPLRVDPVLFRQMMRNVLSNAVKFTRHQEVGIITIHVESMDESHKIYIQDNGVGFEMSDSGRLFEVLQRLHTKEEFEGTGIGLATVKKIMLMHGGEVTIKGQKGEGATVCLIFPRDEENKAHGE